MGEQKRREDAYGNLSPGDRRAKIMRTMVYELNRVFNGDETQSFPVSFAIVVFPASPLQAAVPDCCISNAVKDRVRAALVAQLHLMDDAETKQVE